MFDKNLLVELFETFLSSAVVLFVLYMWIAMPELVYGASMEPSFYTGERVLVEKVTKHFSGFERGDVVVLNPPGNDHIDYIKRIIGEPGNIAKIKGCNVFISVDGMKFKLDEPYLSKDTCTSAMGPGLREGHSVVIDDDHYLVLGDNRSASADSRIFGLVSKDRILGKVVFRFWPFSRIGFL